jgi:NTE family protein
VSVALVLAGGAALGAYEVGVVSYLLDEVANDLGRDLPLEILLGTSAGALNVAFLAAHADRPRERGRDLVQLWTDLRVGQALRPSSMQMLAMVLDGHAPALADQGPGLLDSRYLENLLRDRAPMAHIEEHVRHGRLAAAGVTATHVASGRCVSFVDSRRPIVDEDPSSTHRFVSTRLRAQHALASAAIPFLFPPVLIDGEIYCDGGLRQIVPLAPVARLGARAVVVVNPVATIGASAVPHAGEAVVSPAYLAGKALNALSIDRMEADLSRLRHDRAVLAAGRAVYGDDFDRRLGRELARAKLPPLQEIRDLCVQPSRDIGRLAAEHVAEPAFLRRNPGVVATALRLLAWSDPSRSGDLLAYLLFDGDFAAQLIELGRADARARHTELVTFFSHS